MEFDHFTQFKRGHQIPQTDDGRKRGAKVHAEEAWDSGHADVLLVYTRKNADFRNKLQKLLRRCHRKGEQPNINGIEIVYDKQSKDPLSRVRLKLDKIDVDDGEDFSSLEYFEQEVLDIERLIDLRIEELRQLMDKPRARAPWSITAPEEAQ